MRNRTIRSKSAAALVVVALFVSAMPSAVAAEGWVDGPTSPAPSPSNGDKWNEFGGSYNVGLGASGFAVFFSSTKWIGRWRTCLNDRANDTCYLRLGPTSTKRFQRHLHRCHIYSRTMQLTGECKGEVDVGWGPYGHSFSLRVDANSKPLFDETQVARIHLAGAGTDKIFKRQNCEMVMKATFGAQNVTSRAEVNVLRNGSSATVFDCKARVKRFSGYSLVANKTHPQIVGSQQLSIGNTEGICTRGGTAIVGNLNGQRAISRQPGYKPVVYKHQAPSWAHWRMSVTFPKRCT